jgi:excisionase family DNA binding protein
MRREGQRLLVRVQQPQVVPRSERTQGAQADVKGLAEAADATSRADQGNVELGTALPDISRMPDEVLTVVDVAKLLRVGRNSLYEAIRRDEVPHRRIGRKILLSRRAIMRWLEGWSLQVAKEG